MSFLSFGFWLKFFKINLVFCFNVFLTNLSGFLLVSFISMNFSFAAVTSSNPSNQCKKLFLVKKTSEKKERSQTPDPVLKLKKRSLEEAWGIAQDSFKVINSRVVNRSEIVKAIATTILAREFAWLNGDPGGAKTYLSRLMFETVMASIPDNEFKLFTLQFHKLISEGKIQGFQIFNEMLKEGKFEVETESSLVGRQFLYFIADEVEKSNPATLNALLSVLNERKSFLGARIVDAILASGIFTSNKTMGQYVQGFLEDRPSGEAMLDRMVYKINCPNQEVSSIETAKLLKNLLALKAANEKGKETEEESVGKIREAVNKKELELPLLELEKLISKVQISDTLMYDIVALTRSYDKYVTGKADASRKAIRFNEIKAEEEAFPPNQFSTRSYVKLVKMFKSAFIIEQLAEGVAYKNLRLNPNRKDLYLVGKSSTIIGPSSIHTKSFELSVVEEKDKDRQITNYGVNISSEFGVRQTVFARWKPYNEILVLEKITGEKLFEIQRKGSSWIEIYRSEEVSEYSVNMNSVEALSQRIKEVELENKIDQNKPEFVMDHTIDLYLSKRTVKERTKIELRSMKEDLQTFIVLLNDQVNTPERSIQRADLDDFLNSRSRKDFRKLRQEARRLGKNESESVARAKLYYDWMSYEVKALRQRFVELDYSIEAHLTTILSGNNLFVFGPPGGAKTALAEAVIRAELKGINSKEIEKFVETVLSNKDISLSYKKAVIQSLRANIKPNEFKRFLLQFHKQIPEGVILGFPKIAEQLDRGIEIIETSTSLAGKQFIFAILDEVDKANPATLSALLSILNTGERSVFSGNRVIKTALRAAILTSNKMPSELLDSYYSDRSSGEAVLDRIINKLFVSNKISNTDELVKFLTIIDSKISTTWNGILALNELEPLLKRVTFEEDTMIDLLAMIHEEFLGERIEKQEKAMKASQGNTKSEFPDYYLSPQENASIRSVVSLTEQLKARFIVHQLMEGVPAKDLRLKIEMKDLYLFFEGLAYWGPQKIRPYFNEAGVLQFRVESTIIEGLNNSGVVDSRVKYQLEAMMDEAKDYERVVNNIILNFIQEYKLIIAQYPELFPTLFNNSKARENILND